MARRRQLVEMIGQERNRSRQARSRRVQKSLAATLKVLEAQLAALDRDIDGAVRGSPAWREADDLLTSVPGVGDVTSRTLIADLPELGQIGRRRIAATVGVAPCQPQLRPVARPEGHFRGTHRRAQHPLHGHPLGHPLQPGHPRPLPAPPRQAGRPKKVAIIACLRHLLTILDAILRTKKPWQIA